VRHLRGRGGALAARCHVLEDLGAATGEVLDQLSRDAEDVGRPVGDRRPAHTEAFGEVGAQRGLVEVAGGLGLAVEVATVEC
jgi:hypothetical protein